MSNVCINPVTGQEIKTDSGNTPTNGNTNGSIPNVNDASSFRDKLYLLMLTLALV